MVPILLRFQALHTDLPPPRFHDSTSLSLSFSVISLPPDVCIYIYIYLYIYIYTYMVPIRLFFQALHTDLPPPRLHDSTSLSLSLSLSFSVISLPPDVCIYIYIYLSRRREHLHARALQIRAELSTHIHREIGPQRPTHSFWSSLFEKIKRAAGQSVYVKQSQS